MYISITSSKRTIKAETLMHGLEFAAEGISSYVKRKKQDGKYRRMLRAALTKSLKHPRKQQLCSHLPPISQDVHAR